MESKHYSVYKNIVLLEKGMKRVGRLIPVKIVTKLGFPMTVYKKPEDLTLRKMTKQQSLVMNMYEGEATRLARKFSYQKTALSSTGKEDIMQDAKIGLYYGVMALTKEQLHSPDSEITKKRIKQRIMKYIEEGVTFEQGLNGFVKGWNSTAQKVEKVADVVSTDIVVRGGGNKGSYSSEGQPGDYRTIGDFVVGEIASPEEISLNEEDKRKYSIEKIKHNSILKQLKSILTDTEFNALLWSMDGKSTYEIGDLLKMSHVGAGKVLIRAKDKLSEYGKDLLKVKTFDYEKVSDDLISNAFSSAKLPIPENKSEVKVVEDDALGTENFYIKDRLLIVKYGNSIIKMP